MTRLPIILALVAASCAAPPNGAPSTTTEPVASVLATAHGQVAVPTGGQPGCDESAPRVAAAPTAPMGKLTIPDTHPRLWWTAARLERAKRWHATAGWAPKHNPYYGDDYLDFALRYVLVGDEKAGRRAVDWALGLKLDPGHPGNDARWYGEAAILIYDWCHALMTEEERATMIASWNGWIQAFNEHAWGGLHMPQNNYFWGFMRNGLLWGIATEGDNPRAGDLMRHALDDRWKGSFLPHARQEGRGGVPTEGCQYGQYPLFYAVAGWNSAACLGRNMFNETRFFRDAVYWAIYNTPNAPTVRADTKGKPSYDMFPYADDEMWHEYASAQRLEIGDFMTTAAVTWSDHPVGKYARLYLERVEPKRRAFVRASDPGGEAGVKLAALPLDHHAPGADYLWMRTGWEASDTAVLLQGSANRVSHEHYDAGQFQIWRGGRWLTREVVSYTTTIVGRDGGARVDAGDTLGHNGLVFAGRGQIWPEYRDGPPKITRLMATPKFVFSAIDLSDAYKAKVRPQVHNPYVKSHVREVVFLRELESLVVLDRYEVPDAPPPPASAKWEPMAAADIPVTFLTHFETPPKRAGDHDVVYSAGNQALRVLTLYPAKSTTRLLDEDARIDGRPHRANQHRLEVEMRGPRQGYFLHVLQARDASEPDATVTLQTTASAFEVSIRHKSKGTAMVVFDKGMTSAGGSVGCFGAALPCGNRVELADDVQTFAPLP
jgi:hypothetical protein